MRVAGCEGRSVGVPPSRLLVSDSDRDQVLEAGGEFGAHVEPELRDALALGLASGPRRVCVDLALVRGSVGVVYARLQSYARARSWCELSLYFPRSAMRRCGGQAWPSAPRSSRAEAVRERFEREGVRS
jgi:hypothetical protein